MATALLGLGFMKILFLKFVRATRGSQMPGQMGWVPSETHLQAKDGLKPESQATS